MFEITKIKLDPKNVTTVGFAEQSVCVLVLKTVLGVSSVSGLVHMKLEYLTNIDLMKLS